MSNRNSNEQLIFINVLKSISCICVLIGHVIKGIIKAGIDVSPILYHISVYVYLFHVPCFFFASGYLYANRTINSISEYIHFIIKKLIILGTPYFSCSIFYLFFSAILSSEMNTSYAPNAVMTLWYEPMAQYWYLYALFEFLVIFPLIEVVFGRLNKVWIVLVLALLAMFVDTDIVCLSYIVEYTVFFELGAYFNRNDVLNKININGRQLLIYCCVGSVTVYFCYSIFRENVLLEQSQILKCTAMILLVLATLGISVALAEEKNYVRTFLNWLCKYSLYVYLLHTWFSGTCRIILRKIGITDCWLQSIFGIMIGLAGSILAAMIIRRFSILRFWIEPVPVIKHLSSKADKNRSAC